MTNKSGKVTFDDLQKLHNAIPPIFMNIGGKVIDINTIVEFKRVKTNKLFLKCKNKKTIIAFDSAKERDEVYQKVLEIRDDIYE